MTPINPNKTYSLNDVLKNKFLPGVGPGEPRGYQYLYRKVTHLKNGKRELYTQTTMDTIKPEPQLLRAGEGKISGKIFIRGQELINFLKLNNITPSVAKFS